jgi:hypothetical protein
MTFTIVKAITSKPKSKPKGKEAIGENSRRKQRGFWSHNFAC